MFSLKMLTAAREATTKAKNVASAIQQAQRQVNDDNKDVSKKTDKNEQARAKKKAEAELKNAVAQARLAESQLKRAETQKVVALVQAATSIVGAVIGAAIDKKQKKNDTKQMESGTTATAPTETKPTETTTAPTKNSSTETKKADSSTSSSNSTSGSSNSTSGSSNSTSGSSSVTPTPKTEATAGQTKGDATLQKGADILRGAMSDTGADKVKGKNNDEIKEMASKGELSAGDAKLAMAANDLEGLKGKGIAKGDGVGKKGGSEDVKKLQGAMNEIDKVLDAGGSNKMGSQKGDTKGLSLVGNDVAKDKVGSTSGTGSSGGLSEDGKFGDRTQKALESLDNVQMEKETPAPTVDSAPKGNETAPTESQTAPESKTAPENQTAPTESKTAPESNTEPAPSESEVDTRTLGEKGGDAGKKTGEVIGKILGGPGAAMDAVGGGIDKFFGLNKMSKDDVDGLKAVLEAIMQALGGKKAGGQLSKLLESGSKLGSILTKGGYTDDEGNFHGNKGFAKGLGKIGAMVQAALGTAIGFALSPLTMATKALEGLSKGIAKASNALGYEMAKASGQLEKYAEMGDRLGGRQQKDGSYKLDQNIMGGSLRGMAANDAKKLIEEVQKSGQPMTAEQKKELKSLLTVAFGNDFKGEALDQKVAQVMEGLDGSKSSGTDPGTSLDNATIKDGAMEVDGVKIQTNVTQDQLNNMKENPSSPEAQAFFKAVEAAVSAGKGGADNLSINLAGNTATVSSGTAPTTGDDKTPKPDASKGSITVTAADGKVGVKAEGTLSGQMVNGEKKQKEVNLENTIKNQFGGEGVTVKSDGNGGFSIGTANGGTISIDKDTAERAIKDPNVMKALMAAVGEGVGALNAPNSATGRNMSIGLKDGLGSRVNATLSETSGAGDESLTSSITVDDRGNRSVSTSGAGQEKLDKLNGLKGEIGGIEGQIASLEEKAKKGPLSESDAKKLGDLKTTLGTKQGEFAALGGQGKIDELNSRLTGENSLNAQANKGNEMTVTAEGAANAQTAIDSVFGSDPTKQKFDTDIGKEFASFGLSLAKSIPIFGTIGALIADGAGSTQGDASGLGLLGQSVGNLKDTWNAMTAHYGSSKVDNVQGSMMDDAANGMSEEMRKIYNSNYKATSGTAAEKDAAARKAVTDAMAKQYGITLDPASLHIAGKVGLNTDLLKTAIKSNLAVSSSTDASGNATFTLGVKGAAKDSVGSNLGSISIGKDGTVSSSSGNAKNFEGKESGLLSKTAGNIDYAIKNAGIEGLTANSPEAYRNEMHDKAVGGVIGAFLAGGADNVKQNGAINQTVANMAASTGDKMEIGSTTVDSSGNATVTLKDGRSMTFDKNGAITDMKKADGTSVGTSMEAFFGAGTLKDGVTAAGAVGTYQSNQTKIDALKKTIEDTYGSVESLSVTFGDAGNIVSADAQLGGAFKQNGGGKLGLDLDVGGGRVGINADRSSGNVMSAGGGWKGGMKADNLNQVLRNGAMKENLAFTAARMQDPTLSRAVFNQQVANAGGLDAFLAKEGITITTDFTNRNVARDIGRGIATLGVDALFAQESSNGASFSVTFSRGQEDGKPGVKSFEGFMQYGTNGNNDLNMLQVTSVNQEAKKQLEADKKTLTTELDTLNKKEVKTEDDRARIEAIKLELGTINTSLGQIAAVSDPKGLALNTQNDARSSVGLGQGGPTTFGLVGEADRQAVTHKDEIDGLNKQIADLGPGGDPVKIKELTTKRDGLVKEANDAKEAARTSFKAGEIDQIKAVTGKTEDQILTDRAVEQKVNRDQLKGFEAEVRKSVVQAFADKGIHINADDVVLKDLTYTAGTATGAKDSHAGLWGVSGDISVKDSSGNTYGMNMNLTSREDGSKKLEVGAVTATDANGQKVTDQVTVGDGNGGTKTVSLGDIKGKLENRIGDEFKAQSDFSHGASAVGQGFKSAFASLVDIFAALLPALQALKKAMEDIAEATAKLTAAQEKLAAAQEYANQMGVTADLFGVGNGNLAATINNMTTEQGTESATQLAEAEAAEDPDATHLDNDTSSEEAEALDTLVNDPAASAQLAQIAELMGMNPGQLLVWAQQSDMLVELAEMTHDIANLSPYSATVQTMLMIKEMTSKMEERMNIDISPVNN